MINTGEIEDELTERVDCQISEQIKQPLNKVLCCWYTPTLHGGRRLDTQSYPSQISSTVTYIIQPFDFKNTAHQVGVVYRYNIVRLRDSLLTAIHC